MTTTLVSRVLFDIQLRDLMRHPDRHDDQSGRNLQTAANSSFHSCSTKGESSRPHSSAVARARCVVKMLTFSYREIDSQQARAEYLY